jgi:hypothetical protein
MIHYSCDFCSKPIPREDLRFEVRMEVRVAGDAVDELDPMSELLDEDGLEAFDLAEPDAYRVFRFDLCADCHATFLNDPLSRSRRVSLKHYDN